MKRLLVFLLIGPFICNATLAVMSHGAIRGGWFALPLVSVPLVLLTAAFDYGLKGYRFQSGYVALAGYILAAIMLNSPLGGLAGGLQALLCSWLTNERWAPGEA